jgi:hypothetical protein
MTIYKKRVYIDQIKKLSERIKLMMELIIRVERKLKIRFESGVR